MSKHIHESLSPFGKYKLIIEPNLGKATIYSCDSEVYIGDFKIENPNFPYLFILRNNKEYLIASTNKNSLAIVDCEIGHIHEKTDTNEWIKMWQVDENTLCILNTNDTYQFYDLSNLYLNWKVLNVNYPKDSISKYNYILKKNHHLGLSKNNATIPDPDPTIQNQIITFVTKELRVYGIGINHNNVKEIDMELREYEKQLQDKDGVTIPYLDSKTYQLDMSRMNLRRNGDNMEMFDFWRDERQLKIDGDVSVNEMCHSERYKRIYNFLKEKLPSKFNIRRYISFDGENHLSNIMITSNFTRSYYYNIVFKEEKDSQIKIEYHNYKFPYQNTKLSICNEEGIIDLIDCRV
jgi:hypothetical protein